MCLLSLRCQNTDLNDSFYLLAITGKTNSKRERKSSRTDEFLKGNKDLGR